MNVSAVGVVILLLCGWTSSQEIRVVFDSAPITNNNLYMTVARVPQLVFYSEEYFLRRVSDGDLRCIEDSADSHNCTVELMNAMKMSKVVIGVYQSSQPLRDVNVTVNVEDDYIMGCAEHQFPSRLNLQDKTGMLSCVPVFVNDASQQASGVTWYMSKSTREFATVFNLSAVNTENTNNVTNSTIIFRQAKMEDAAFYFPVPYGWNGNLNEIPSLLLTYEPMITAMRFKIEEFSRDIYLNPNVPHEETFSCEVKSFPQPRIIWRYNNHSRTAQNCSIVYDPEESEGQQDRDEISICFTDRTSQSNETTADSMYIFNLTIMDVDYKDSGSYSCFPENDAFLVELLDTGSLGTNAHTYRIRVKDHLRPLWPAIGIILVFIIVAVMILLGELVERLRPKNKSNKKGGSHPYAVGSTSSGSPDATAVQFSDGHVHLRRISSAKVQLLEEPVKN